MTLIVLTGPLKIGTNQSALSVIITSVLFSVLYYNIQQAAFIQNVYWDIFKQQRVMFTGTSSNNGHLCLLRYLQITNSYVYWNICKQQLCLLEDLQTSVIFFGTSSNNKRLCLLGHLQTTNSYAYWDIFK